MIPQPTIPVINTLEKSGMMKWKQRFFSKDGYENMESFAWTLIDWYLDIKKEYPFKMGIILGQPQFEYAQAINSRELLLERIKIVMCLLGKKELRKQLENGSTKTFSIDIEVKEDRQ